MNIQRFTASVLTCMAVLVMSQQASALSCARPDVVRSCKAMQEASQAPIVANGELRLSKIISQETNRMVIGNKGAAVAEYLFTGSLSDKSGKRDVKDAKLRISTSCIASWCGRLPEENSSGYFLFKSEEKVGLTLSIGACTFQPFSVTGKQATELEACATPEPVVVKPQPPKEMKPKAGSQIFSQDQADKSLVK